MSNPSWPVAFCGDCTTETACPLHDAAGDMRDALEALLTSKKGAMPWTQARAALDKAKKK